jgi:hypothetical protein
LKKKISKHMKISDMKSGASQAYVPGSGHMDAIDREYNVLTRRTCSMAHPPLPAQENTQGENNSGQPTCVATQKKGLTKSEEQCHATVTAARATSLPRPASADAMGTTLAAAGEHTKQKQVNINF